MIIMEGMIFDNCYLSGAFWIKYPSFYKLKNKHVKKTLTNTHQTKLFIIIIFLIAYTLKPGYTAIQSQLCFLELYYQMSPFILRVLWKIHVIFQWGRMNVILEKKNTGKLLPVFNSRKANIFHEKVKTWSFSCSLIKSRIFILKWFSAGYFRRQWTKLCLIIKFLLLCMLVKFPSNLQTIHTGL